MIREYHKIETLFERDIATKQLIIGKFRSSTVEFLKDIQIIYGRTQSAFSENGLPIGAGLEDLGKGLRSQTGTIYSTLEKGPRYLELTEGYITRLALDENNEIIGYEYLSLGKFTDFLKKGIKAEEALEKAKGTYGRFADGSKYIDPREE